MSIITAISILILLFILELLYFKIADHYNIIDKPNHRSSHTSVTIRGGGIIFGLAAILFCCIYQFQYPYFILGLFLISLVSFVDDIMTLNNKIRLSIHLLAVSLMFLQLGFIDIPWFLLIIGFIFVIGTINAYNFMDGINGITGAYSLGAIATLYYINEYVVLFTSRELLIMVGLALLVFNFFNFREKAKCFAGDVGSVSIAFIILFVLLQLIIKTQNLSYILILLVYGLDTVTTIISRVIKRENIFEAHRSHFYQYWVNERKKSHLLIATIYTAVQLLINLSLISLPNTLLVSGGIILGSGIVFVIARFINEGSKRLLRN